MRISPGCGAADEAASNAAASDSATLGSSDLTRLANASLSRCTRSTADCRSCGAHLSCALICAIKSASLRATDSARPPQTNSTRHALPGEFFCSAIAHGDFAILKDDGIRCARRAFQDQRRRLRTLQINGADDFAQVE